MTLNKSKIEGLIEDNLEEAKNKAVLLYAEYGYLDYGIEDTKKIISLFNKKKSSSKTEQMKKAFSELVPEEKCKSKPFDPNMDKNLQTHK
ncbi:37971_t:CDS:2, partial [Gigaspora margarita]